MIFLFQYIGKKIVLSEVLEGVLIYPPGIRFYPPQPYIAYHSLTCNITIAERVWSFVPKLG